MESPPWALQAGSYNAEQTRRAVFAWLSRTSANTPGIVNGGLVGAADCQLSAPGSGLSVNVSVGELIMGGNEGAVQGAGYGRVSSTTNLAISAANPSNPRVDLICATMSDAGYTEPTGGSGSQWALQVITGTPTASASLANLLGVGALPLSSLLLGYVLVPTSAANIITADIANVATVVRLQFTANGPWVPLTLTATPGSGVTSLGLYTPSARLEGSDVVRLKGSIQNSTGGAIAQNGTWATLPVGMRPSLAAVTSAVLIASGGGGTATSISHQPSGSIQISMSAPSTTVLQLDGVTFSLT